MDLSVQWEFQGGGKAKDQVRSGPSILTELWPLEAHPDKMPKEIAELLQAEGVDVKPQLVSTIKSNLKSKRDKKAAPKAAPKKVPAGAKAGDAISLDSLKKAKELATQLGGIKQAKAAIAALAELVD